MKILNLRVLIAIAGLLMVFASCKKKEEEKPTEQEVITTLRLTITKTDASGNALVGVAPIVATWKDADGEGANLPTVDNITLAANAYYKVEMAVLNELANPAQDLTSEIRNEGAAHQFFFEKTATSLNAIQYDDQDANGKPIGLKFKLSTTATSSTGTFKVILRHEPNKNGANVSTGDITNAGGETDIETTPAFNMTISAN